VHGIKSNEVDKTVGIKVGSGRFIAAPMGNLEAVFWVESLRSSPVEQQGRLLEERPSLAVGEDDSARENFLGRGDGNMYSSFGRDAACGRLKLSASLPEEHERFPGKSGFPLIDGDRDVLFAVAVYVADGRG
jgi:hypothetical protein